MESRRSIVPSVPAGTPSVVVCDNIWFGEAISQSLDLSCCAVLRLRHTETDLPRLLLASRSPKLAIIVASEEYSLAPSVRILRRRWPEIKVLVAGLSNHEDAILRAVAARVDGIVLAEETLEQLAAAVRVVLSDAFRSPPQLIRPLFNRLARLILPKAGRQPPIVRLSAREVEILRHIELGESNKAIAAQLFVEEQTVKNHVTKILRKLGVRTRYGAARVAAEMRDERASG